MKKVYELHSKPREDILRKDGKLVAEGLLCNLKERGLIGSYHVEVFSDLVYREMEKRISREKGIGLGITPNKVR